MGILNDIYILQSFEYRAFFVCLFFSEIAIDMYFNLMKEMYFFVFSSFCLGYGHARNESLQSSPCQNSITRYTWNLCCTEKIFQETVSAIFYYISHIFFMAAITSRYSSVYIFFFGEMYCIAFFSEDKNC